MFIVALFLIVPNWKQPNRMDKQMVIHSYNGVLLNNKKTIGLAWWCSGWESTCWCRGHGFEPWSGKISHRAEQLSLCATTTEHAL